MVIARGSFHILSDDVVGNAVADAKPSQPPLDEVVDCIRIQYVDNSVLQ